MSSLKEGSPPPLFCVELLRIRRMPDVPFSSKMMGAAFLDAPEEDLLFLKNSSLRPIKWNEDSP